MSDERAPLAQAILDVINDEFKAREDTDDRLSYSEILFALRMCSYTVIEEVKDEDRKAAHITEHLKGLAHMLGMPLIAVETEEADQRVLN